MRLRPSVVTLWSLALAACGGGAPAPPSLAYSLPDPADVTYVQGDTATMDIDAGGQSFRVALESVGTYAATFQRADDGLRVSMRIQDFHGRLTQPMQGPTAVDGSGIEGPLVFTMDRKGAATVVSMPTVSGPGTEMLFEPVALVHSFFPRLPGGPVTTGTSWTDTTSFDGQAAGGTMNGTAVTTYTVSGDTVVAGRSLVRIAFEGTATESSAGTIAEMDSDFTRTLESNVKGWVLWDANRHIMTEKHTELEGQGTMDIAMAPQAFGFGYRQVRHIALGGDA